MMNVLYWILWIIMWILVAYLCGRLIFRFLGICVADFQYAKNAETFRLTQMWLKAHPDIAKNWTDSQKNQGL